MLKKRGVNLIQAFLCALLLTACSRSSSFRHRGSSGVAWYGPSVTDLGAEDSSRVSFSSGPTGQNRAALDFRIQGNGESAALVLSAYDGSHWRALGRSYEPYSRGGNGWASTGSSFQFIDNGGGIDLTQIALAMSASGDTLAVFGDAATAAGTLNAGFAAGGTWGAKTPSIGATITQAPISGELAWDSSGTAYYAYIDGTGTAPTGKPGLIRYTSFSAWDAAADIVALGTAATQIGVKHDGYATQVVWRGDRPLRSITAFSGGADFACAINSAGGALCWGENGLEQLGIGGGSGADQAYPQEVADPAGASAFSRGVTAISAGTAHACAVYLGGAYCWGDNTRSQLSSGASMNPQTTPAGVTGLTGGSVTVAAVAAGGDFSCALDDAGGVHCWGANDVGQVGNAAAGMTASEADPLDADVSAAATAVVAGSQHACALTAAGGVECWGEGSLGQIGNGATADTATPTAATGLSSGVTAITAGSNHACALKSDATVVCWGSNASGQIGDNTTTDRSTPTAVKTGATASLKGVLRIAASGDTTCAVTRGQVLYCWGSNASGQILGAAGAAQTTALAIGGLQGAAAYPRVGGTFACATLTDGLTECWGANASGQLGNGGAASPVSEPKLLSEECADGAGRCAILAASDIDGYASATPLSSSLASDARNFSMASDDKGNTLVVFLQKNPAASACDASTTPPTRNCEYRVYASFHSVSGAWTGPTQLDDPTLFASTSTTLYQDSNAALSGVPADAAGGVEFPTPPAAYLGDEVFLAAFPMIDTSAGTSGVYSRAYDVGTGWDDATATVEIVSMDTGSAEAYRVANDLQLAGGGDGSAMLSLQIVHDSDDNSDALLRSYGFRFYPYLSGSWRPGETTDDGHACAGPSALPAAAGYFCWGLKARGAMFYGGEATVVFPAPDEDDPTKLRLYEMEYR